jgi:hypothetical protein
MHRLAVLPGACNQSMISRLRDCQVNHFLAIHQASECTVQTIATGEDNTGCGCVKFINADVGSRSEARRKMRNPSIDIQFKILLHDASFQVLVEQHARAGTRRSGVRRGSTLGHVSLCVAQAGCIVAQASADSHYPLMWRTQMKISELSCVMITK